MCLFNVYDTTIPNSSIPTTADAETTSIKNQDNELSSKERAGLLGPNFSAFKNSNITPRVLDEIVWPMRQLQMREEEFVCLKALALLHPEAKGLSQGAQSLIREARNQVLKALYAYIMSQNASEAPTRYGNILLLAPALKALTQILIENMTLTRFFGLSEVDTMLSQFILDDLTASAPLSVKERLAAPLFSITQNTTNNNMSIYNTVNASSYNQNFEQVIF